MSTTSVDDQLTSPPDDVIDQPKLPPSIATDPFSEAVRPLMKWLAENMHPHSRVIVDSNSAVLMEDSMCYRTDDFLVD